LKEWSRPDRTYARCATDIETGAGYAVLFPWSAATVFRAAVPPNFLNGGTGTDTFYYDPIAQSLDVFQDGLGWHESNVHAVCGFHLSLPQQSRGAVIPPSRLIAFFIHDCD
jgi:hypothetical protein